MMIRTDIERKFEIWCKKLRVMPEWNIRLEWVEDENWSKTGDIKIYCDTKTAVVLLNGRKPKSENLEEVLVHELFHLKMYPLDQLTETLIVSYFQEGTPAYEFAYSEFMLALEQTVQELTKCFLLEFGEERELSMGACRATKSFGELYDGLKDLD